MFTNNSQNDWSLLVPVTAVNSEPNPYGLGTSNPLNNSLSSQSFDLGENFGLETNTFNPGGMNGGGSYPFHQFYGNKDILTGIEPVNYIDTINTNGSLFNSGRKEIAFVDSQLYNYQTLIQGLDKGIQVVVLDSKQNQINQIAQVLSSQNRALDAIHIFSHGSAGALQLGNTVLNQNSLEVYQNSLTSWGQSLKIGGDLLLYGCDVAQGATGRDFVQNLSQITGADVAASDDLTGSANLGGDWNLEVNTGDIFTKLPFQASALDAYKYILPMFSGTRNLTTATFNENIIIQGDTTLNVTGDLTITNLGKILGDGVGALDNLTIKASGNVILGGMVGGGGLNNITIEAQSINVLDGVNILTPGDISFTTENNSSALMNLLPGGSVTSKEASITLGNNSFLQAANITLTAEASDENPTEELPKFVNGFIVQPLLDFGTAIASLPINVVIRDSSASVTLGNNAKLITSGDIEISATSKADSTAKVLNQFFSIGYSGSNASAVTTIGTGAVIKADGDVNILSDANAVAGMTTRTLKNLGEAPTDPTGVAISLAIANATVTSKTTVSQGALIEAGGNANIVANGKTEREASSEAGAYGSDGKGGLSAALGFSKANINTFVDGKVSSGSTLEHEFNPISAVNSNADTITIANHGFKDGQAVIYQNNNDADSNIGELEDRTTYYVMVVDDNTIKLAESVSDLEEEKAIDLKTAGVQGNAHILKDPGIRVIAQLESEDAADATSGVGGDPSVADNIEKPEIAVNKIIEKLTEDNYSKNSNSGGSGGNSNVSAAGAFVFSKIDNNVTATVGSNAVLESQLDLSVQASISENIKTAAEAATEDPESEGGGETTTTNTTTTTTTSPENNANRASAAVIVGLYSNNAQATIENNAVTDASQDTRVTSEVSYPFRTTLKEHFDLGEKLKEDGIGGLTGYMDGKLGIQSELFNSWAVSTAETDGQIALAGSVNYQQFNNNSQAIIKSGAKINQNEDFKPESDDQTVSVEATTEMELINVTGVFKFDLSYESLQELVKEKDPLAIYNPAGSSGGKGGVGGAFFLMFNNSNTIARVENGTKIYTGADGGLTINAESNGTDVNVAQAGGSGGKFGVGGTFSFTNQESKTIAQLESGAEVTGGSLEITANDKTTRVTAVGGVAKSENLGVGLSVGINQMNRETAALIGYQTGTGGTGTSIGIDGDIKVEAKADGGLWAFSLAAAVASKSEEQSPEQPSEASSEEAKSGIGISGDVSLNTVTDKVYAYINDVGTIEGDNVSITAENSSQVRTASGAVAMASSDPDKTSAGIAGSFSMNTLNGTTSAYISGSATNGQKLSLTANKLSVSATRSGDLFALSAGGAAAPGKKGYAVSGSVSLNKISNTTDAFIKGTQANISGDVALDAKDTSNILALAGAVSIGGKAAFGAAIAINKITSTTRATIENADITASKGLTINAKSTSTIRGITLAGTASVSKGDSNSNTFSASGAGSSSVNTINSSIIAGIANGSTIKAGSGNTISITATDDSKIHAIAGGGALALTSSDGSSGALSIAVTVAKNEIDNKTNAYIDSSTISSSDDTDINFDLQALSTATISAQSVAVAVSAAKAQQTGLSISGGGAGADNVIVTKTNAYVNASNLTDGIGNVGIKANNTGAIDATVIAISGSVTIGAEKGAGAAIGAAVANNFIGYDESNNRKPSEVQAYIRNSSLKASGDLKLDAIAKQTINAKVGAGSVAVAASKGTNLSGSGSGVSTQNNIATLVKAFIDGDGATGIESKSATLTAKDSSTITADAGAASISAAVGKSGAGALSIGVALARNLISNEVEASIKNADNSVKTTTGGIALSATTQGSIRAVSVAASVAVGVAPSALAVSLSGAGAESTNTILSKTNAYISGSVVDSAGVVNLSSTNTSGIDATVVAVAASVSAGSNGAGVSIGAAVANNFIGYNDNNRQPAEVQAYIQNSSLTASGDLKLSAIANQVINAKVGAGSVAVAASKGTSLSGSGSGVSTQNNIATLVKAFIDGDRGTGIQSNTATLTAADSSSITADAGAASLAAAVGSKAGASLSIGVALANNLISNEVEAFIKSASNSVKTTTGDVSLSATTNANIQAVSVAASIAAGFGSTAGVAISGAGAASINTILTLTNAYIKDSVVNSAGGVNLTATNTATISATVAAVSVSASGGSSAGVGVSIGAAVANNFIGYDGSKRQPASVQAYIQNSSLTAGGDLKLSAINSGSITAGVGAGSAAISGGGKAGVAASGSGVSTENKIATLIKAFIDGDGATGIQAKTATLTALDSSTISADAGAASVAASFGGKAGVSLSIGVALAHNVVTNEVQAFIQNADNFVKTNTGNVSLSATTEASIKAVSVAASLAAGISGVAGIAVSGAGAESTNTISTLTNAYVKDSVINSAGAVNINAKNTAEISAKVVAASVAVGASAKAGVAASIGVAVARNLIGWEVDKTDTNYKYTTGSGKQSLNRGDRVLIAEGARAGDIYEFIGNPTSIDLETADFAKTSDWKQVNLKQNASSVLAYTSGSSINAGSALSLSSVSSSTIEATVASVSMAVAGGIGGASLSGSGVSTENKIATKVQAYVDGDGSTGISAGSVSLTATDTSSISANAEAVSVGVTIAIGGAVTIGVSLARNEIANDVRAYVQNVNNVTATDGGIQLRAKETSTITATSVAASAAVGLVGVAGAGAEATNTIANAAKSYISNAIEVKAQKDVTLISSDTSIIRSLAGQFSAGTAAAIGVSIATNTISNQIIAEVANSKVISSTGAIKLDATSNNTIETLGIGGSVGGSVAEAGATTLNKITSTTSANTRGVSTLQAAGAVTLTASDDSTIKSLAGQLSVGGAAGVGAGVATNDIANNIIAELGGTAVTAGFVALSATSNGYVGSIAVGASGGGSFALGGAITLNKIANVIKAGTSDGSSITTTGSVSLKASDTPTIESLAGQVSGGGGASVGLSLAKNEISSQVIAEISNTTFKAKAASVSLTATSVGSIRSAAVGGAAAGALAAGGSVTLNTIRKVVKAAISGGSDVQSQGAVSLTAFDNSPILSLAGQVAVAGAATVGIAVATNDIANQVIAEVNNSKATSLAGGITLNATSTGLIKTLGIAGAVSGGFSGAGAVTVNSIANVIKAGIVNSSDVQSAGNLNLTAAEDAKIESLAGSVSVGGAASFGASVATNNISSQIVAEVSKSKVTTSGAVNLSATSTGTIDSLAAGGSGAGTFAAGGAVTVNNLSNTVRANIANGSDVQAPGNVGLTATNSATIQSLAGQITGAGGAAIGASVAVNNSSNKTQAYISNSTVASTAGQIKATASDKSTIKSASAGASVSGGVALTGSVSVNNITNTTDAHATNARISALSRIEISAADEATIQSFAGQISVGIGAAGVGAAVAYNNISNIVTAYVKADDGQFTTVDTSGNAIVSASGKGTIETIAAGGSAGLFIGAGASVAVNQMSNNISAYSQNSIIRARGSAGILADSTNSMTTKGGTFSGGFIGLGGTIAVNNLENTTRAYADNSSVDAVGEQSITIPKTDGSGTKESFQGVAVLATSKDNLGVTIGTGGVGGYAFVASVAVNNFSNTTQAYVNNATINATIGSSIPEQSVYIKAFNDSTVNVDAGTVGGGLAAAGVGVDITTMNNATAAYINSSDLINSQGSIVSANKDLVVEAKTQKSLTSNVVAKGGGGISVQGAVSIINVSSGMSNNGADALKDKDGNSDLQNKLNQQLNDLDGMGKDSNGKSNISTKKNISNAFANSLPAVQGTTAFITGTARAGNNLIVNAYETTKVNVSVGSLSGGLISVGGAVGVTNITHNTSAYVGERSALTGGNITIQSTGFVDSTKVKAVAGSAGVVGLGAAVSYLSSENNSKAYIGNNTKITQANNINVIGGSSSNLNAEGWGASFGAAAVGVVIANAKETGTTQAYIGDSVQVENTKNLSVKAIANEAVAATSEAASGGILSGNGSVPTATISPTVKAYIGDNANIKVDEDVQIISDVTVDGDANAKGISIGGIAVGVSLAEVNSNPNISTHIGANSKIEAGNVIVESRLGKPSVSADPSFNPSTAVNNARNTITFNGDHGLKTGDQLVYLNGGGTDIKGLTNQQNYGVIFVDSKTVKFGSEFSATTVDTKFNTIKFSNGHSFKDNDKVIYETNGGSAVGGLVSGNSYYVKVIDSSTIRLSQNPLTPDVTQGVALGDIVTSTNPNTTINFNSNSFNNGDTVTYQKRSAQFTIVSQVPDTQGKANIFNLDTGEILSKDTINSASHGFETNDQVIYSTTGIALGGLVNGQKYYVIKVDDNKFKLSATQGGTAIDITDAKKDTTHKITAVGLNIFTGGQAKNFTYSSSNNNTIGLNAHGFSTGDTVTYQTTGTALSGLAAGQVYYVIKVDNNNFKLASSLANAQNGTAISIGTNISQHQVVVTTANPLEEGVTYYVVERTSSSFKLATTAGGAALKLDGTGLSGSGRNHLFKKETTIDLTSVGTGQQNLLIDLDNSTATGSKHLLSAGASAVVPSQGDQVFSAYSQASAGALVGVNATKTTLNITPTLTTYVGSNASITTTGNVTVKSLSSVQVTGATTSETFGAIAVGASTINSTVNNTNNTYVGNGAIINAKGNVSITGHSDNNLNISASGGAGSLITFANAKANANLNHITTTTIGDNANIIAQNDLLVRSSSSTNSNVKSKANGIGLYADADAGSSLFVNGTNRSNINSNARLEGRTLAVEAIVDNLNVEARSEAYGAGLIGNIDTKSTVNLSGTNATVNIGSGSYLKGDYINLTALYKNVTSNAIALSDCDGLGGDTDSETTNIMPLEAKVFTDSSSKLEVYKLNVKSDFETFNRRTYSHSDKAWELRIWTPFGDIVITMDFGSESKTETFAPKTVIDFNSNVNFLARGANPVLVVDRNGQITQKSENVTANVTGSDVIVNDINNTATGEVNFIIPSRGSEVASNGLFIDRGKYTISDPAFDTVQIENYSDKNLVINSIRAINSGAVPNINYNVNVNNQTRAANKQTSPNSLLANPTVVTINNWGSSNLILRGTIDNPHDRTTLYSSGSILSQGSTQKIITRDLKMTAVNGSIGANGQRIAAQLNQGYTQITSKVPSSSIYLNVEAQNSTYLDLTAKALNNNPVTVDVQKMTAATGEVNLTIGQTTNNANTAISALYKFTDLYNLDQRITAGTNITINAGTTTTNIDSKTALFGIASSLDVVTGGLVNVTNITGAVNLKRAVSYQDAVKLNARDVVLVDNAVVQAARDVTLTVTNLSMLNNANLQAGTDVNFLVADNFQVSSTATVIAGNNVLIQGDHNNQDSAGASINIDGWIYAQKMFIYGDTNQDVFNIRRLATTTELYTGGDDDIVNIGNSQNRTNEIQKRLTVYSGSQNDADTLNVNNSGDTSNNTGVLTDTSLTGLGMGEGIYYNGFEVLNIRLGAGNDDFTILNTSATTNIDSGAGDDRFRVGPRVDASGNVLDEIVDGTFMMGANILGTSNITNIKTGAGNDYIQVTRNMAMLNIEGESGDDTFVVNTAIAYSSLLTNAAVNISGDDGYDTTTVNGSSLLETIQNNGTSVDVMNSRFISLMTNENLIINGNTSTTGSSGGTGTTGGSNPTLDSLGLDNLDDRTIVTSTNTGTTTSIDLILASLGLAGLSTRP